MENNIFTRISKEKPLKDGTYIVLTDHPTLGIVERKAKYIVGDDDWYYHNEEVGFYTVHNVIAWRKLKENK